MVDSAKLTKVIDSLIQTLSSMRETASRGNHVLHTAEILDACDSLAYCDFCPAKGPCSGYNKLDTGWSCHGQLGHYINGTVPPWQKAD